MKEVIDSSFYVLYICEFRTFPKIILTAGLLNPKQICGNWMNVEGTEKRAFFLS